jgi:hypothetical protein
MITPNDSSRVISHFTRVRWNHSRSFIKNQEVSNLSVPCQISSGMDTCSLAELHVLLWIRRRRRRTRIWVHDLNTKRPDFGAFSPLFPDLLNDPDQFFGFFRMKTESFKKLVDLTGIAVKKMDTNCRCSIGI